MKLGELKSNLPYTDGELIFTVDEHENLFFKNKEGLWLLATDEYSVIELGRKEFKELQCFTDEEKELARCALKLGIKVIVKEGDNFYCSADDDIWMGNFDSWENNIGIWLEEDELPLLLKSSLVEKVKENKPLYLEDVVK